MSQRSGHIRRLALCSVGVAAACKLGLPTQPVGPVGSLAGTWDIEKYLLQSVDNPAVQSDLIAGGLRGSLDLASSGSFTIHISFPNDPPVTQTGLITVHKDTLRYALSGDSAQVYTYTHDSTSMSWSLVNPIRLDITSDGKAESVRAFLTWKR